MVDSEWEFYSISLLELKELYLCGEHGFDLDMVLRLENNLYTLNKMDTTKAAYEEEISKVELMLSELFMKAVSKMANCAEVCMTSEVVLNQDTCFQKNSACVSKTNKQCIISLFHRCELTHLIHEKWSVK